MQILLATAAVSVYSKQIAVIDCCCPEFCEKSNLRWHLAGNLAPCSCAGAVEYIVHSCTVLVAKHDLPLQSIHRLDQTRTGLVDKSQLMCYVLYTDRNVCL